MSDMTNVIMYRGTSGLWILKSSGATTHRRPPISKRLQSYPKTNFINCKKNVFYKL